MIGPTHVILKKSKVDIGVLIWYGMAISIYSCMNTHVYDFTEVAPRQWLLINYTAFPVHMFFRNMHDLCLVGRGTILWHAKVGPRPLLWLMR